MEIGRRRFLSVCKALLAFMATASPLALGRQATLLTKSIENIHPGESVFSLGEKYLQFITDENNPQLLVDISLTKKVVDMGVKFEALPSDVFKEYVECKVLEDFDNGRTVRIDGWLYSETELQYAAHKAIEYFA
ncbi:hypothetical protein JYU12_02120 [bacterium AH-315-K03]|nr:hypothetical protein [bacterium AH-315-K03]